MSAPALARARECRTHHAAPSMATNAEDLTEHARPARWRFTVLDLMPTSSAASGTDPPAVT